MKLVKQWIWTLLILTMASSPAYSQSLWNTAADGSWQIPGNWTPTGTPGAGDDATINIAGGPYTVTLNAATAINNLTIDSATATLNTNSQNFAINGSFNLLAGTFTQTGGSVSGTLVTSTGTTWNWNNSVLGGGSFTNGGALNYLGTSNRVVGGAVVNSGTWNVQGTGTILANNGSSINNSGVIDLQLDSTFVTGNQITLTMTNSGTLRKSVGAGVSTINAIFNSTGIIEAQAGTINFGSGGTVSNTITAAAGAAVNLSSLTLNGAISGTGAGTVRINGTIGVAAGGTTLTYGGTSLEWTAGNINGPGSFTNAGTMTHDGNSNRVLGTALINNTGSTYTVIGAGTILADNGSSITNAGLIDLQVDSTFVTSNQSLLTITNSGTLRKSAGSGTSTINAIFNSTGTIEAQTGTLNFGNGGTVTNTITADTGATINLSSLTLSGAIGGSGMGTIRINNTVNAAMGGATLTYGGTTLEWTAGNINGPGSFTNAGTMTHASNSNRVLGTALINNAGSTYPVTGTGTILADNGSSITNAGLIDLRVDSTFVATNQITLIFTNSGTLRKSVASGTSTINAVFNSTGIVDVQTGTLNFGSGGTITGTVNASTGAIVNLGSLTLSGTITGSGGGLVRIDNGSIAIAAAGATLNYTGAMAQWSGANTNIFGPGTLTNAGTLTISGSGNRQLATPFVNSGTVNVTDVGTILADNTSSFTNNGTFDIQSDGTVIANNQIQMPFTNTGMLRKSAGNDTSLLNVGFSSTGTIDVQTGTLSFSSSSGSVSGTLNAATNAILNLNSLTLTGALSGSGGGRINFNNIGIAAAGATINFPGSLAHWSVSNIGGLGSLTNAATGTFTMSGSANKVLFIPIVNNGTFNVTGTGMILANNGSAINNSGTIDFQLDSTFVTTNQIALTLTNNGTLRKSAGTGSTVIDAIVVNDGGTIAIDQGTIRLARGLSFGDASNLDIIGGDTSNTFLTVIGLVQKTGTDPLLVRPSNDGTLDLTGMTEYTWLVLDGNNLGALTTADFAFDPIDFNATDAMFSITSNDVFVTFHATPIPEPLALVAVGLAGVLALRRRLI